MLKGTLESRDSNRTMLNFGIVKTGCIAKKGLSARSGGVFLLPPRGQNWVKFRSKSGQKGVRGEWGLGVGAGVAL